MSKRFVSMTTHHASQVNYAMGYTGDDWFGVGTLKCVADGGILIGAVFLREPYGEHTDIYGYKDPDYRGGRTRVVYQKEGA